MYRANFLASLIFLIKAWSQPYYAPLKSKNFSSKTLSENIRKFLNILKQKFAPRTFPRMQLISCQVCKTYFSSSTVRQNKLEGLSHYFFLFKHLWWRQFKSKLLISKPRHHSLKFKSLGPYSDAIFLVMCDPSMNELWVT